MKRFVDASLKLNELTFCMTLLNVAINNLGCDHLYKAFLGMRIRMVVALRYKLIL